MILTKEQILEVEDIEKASCRFFGVDVEGLFSKTTKRKESLARAFVFYILHVDMNISIGCIVKRYGRKSNAVFKSLSKTKYGVEKIHSYREMYLGICNARKA